MAFDWIREIAQRQYTLEDKPLIKGKREFLARLTDKSDSPELVAAHAPQIGHLYTVTQPNLKCTAVDIKQKEVDAEGGTVYEVTADYSTESESQDGGDPDAQQDDPTDRPIEMRASFDRTEEPFYLSYTMPVAEDEDGTVVDITTSAYYTKNGKAVINSAGNPFDPNPMTSITDMVITITKNVETSDFAAMWRRLPAYINRVNADTFSILYRGRKYRVPAGTAWMFDIATESGYEMGVQFERVTLVMKLREDGWKRRFLDAGYHAWPLADHPNDKAAPAWRDAYGEPVTEMVLLDGFGAALKPPAKPLFLIFEDKLTATFRNFPIPELV